MTITIHPENRIRLNEILQFPESEAIAWLKNHQRLNDNSIRIKDETQIHKIASFAFLRRDSKRLRFTAARFGSDIQSLRRILQTGNSNERQAILSNPYIGPYSLIDPHSGHFKGSGILTESDADTIVDNIKTNKRDAVTLLSNPYVGRNWLTAKIQDLIEKEKFWNDGLLPCIQSLVHNPVIKEIRDDTLMDGYADFVYNQLNLTLCSLLEHVPIHYEWSATLHDLLIDLLLPFTPDFQTDIIERWKGDDHYFLREKITQKLIVRDHRLKSKKKFTLKHEDQAVRIGLYKSLPEYKIFEGIKKTEEFVYPSFKEDFDTIALNQEGINLKTLCINYFERDGNEFVEALLANPSLWTSQKKRQFLNDLSWNLAHDPHSLMDVPNTQRFMERYYRERNPEFFRDEESNGIVSLSDLQDHVYQLDHKIDEIFKYLKNSDSSDETLNLQQHVIHKIDEGTKTCFEHLSYLSQIITKLDAGQDSIKKAFGQSQNNSESLIRSLNNSFWLSLGGFGILLAVILFFST